MNHTNEVFAKKNPSGENPTIRHGSRPKPWGLLTATTLMYRDGNKDKKYLAQAEKIAEIYSQFHPKILLGIMVPYWT